jgi:hypothetical protein
VITVASVLGGHSTESLDDLLNIMNRVTLRSLTENRKGMGQFPADLVTVEKEYRDFLAYQARALATGTPMKHMNQETFERLKEIQKILIEKHPWYKSLPLLGSITVDQLQTKLDVREVVYQVVIGEMWSASIILTRSKIFFDIARIGRGDVERLVKSVSEYILAMPNDKMDMNEFYNSMDILSKKLFGALTDFLKENDINRVYLCSDVTLGMFSLSLVRVEGDWLIERINSIHNITTPSELLGDGLKSEPKYDVRSFLFGPDTDRAISKITTWQQKKDISKNIIVDKLDTSKPSDETQRLNSVKPYIAFIAGHGVHDTIDHGGAIFFQGKKERVSARDLKPILETCECAIVLSCSGGQPVSRQPESREGIWAGIIGAGLKSAILCTWDVDVEATLGIIEYVLKFDRSKFSTVLCEVKRGMIRSADYSNPYYWAGVEYWGRV